MDVNRYEWLKWLRENRWHLTDAEAAELEELKKEAEDGGA